MRRTFSWVTSAFISIMLISSIMLLIGFGGTGLQAKVSTDGKYHPYIIGHMLIEVRNGWWLRNINLTQISISIDNIQTLKWEVGKYTSNISPGETINIPANLTILEYKFGVFSFQMTISYTQSSVFTFGLEEARYIISGNITISS